MSETDVIFRPVVGIDLGTTNSLVAYIRDGRPEVMPMDGMPLLPSVVHRTTEGTLLVGKDAKSALVAMPDRTVASIKRRMGTDDRVSLGEDQYSPVEISAMILRRIKVEVDMLYGEGPKEAVITVPAYFNDRQRRHTKEAGEQAGFVVERIINEPTAAAMAFGLEHLDATEKVVVYDLGGGTFDVSVVQMEDGILEVVASDGHRALGGDDFDLRIVDRWCEMIEGASGFDPHQDMRAMARLKQEAETAKMALSEVEQVEVSIPVVTVVDDHPISFSTTLIRSDFEGLIEPLLQETLKLTRRTLKAAEVKPKQVSRILLVGGSTRIPRVRELIQAEFGKTPETEVDPDQAVVLGAAVQAGIKSGAMGDTGLIVTDVAPFTMGIAVVMPDRRGVWREGGYAPVIRKNTTVPTTRTERFSTMHHDQTAINVEIYQGESEWVKGNEKLGSLMVSDLPPGPAGQESIEVTFRYTLNGILEVSAHAISTGKTVEVRVHDALDRSSDKTLQESEERIASRHQETDLELDEDDDDELLDEPSWEQMTSDVERLVKRLKKLRQSSNSGVVDELVGALEKAHASEEPSSLLEALDRTYEWLLDGDE